MACACSSGGDTATKLLYACAGADLSGFIQSAKEAGKNIVIDRVTAEICQAVNG